MGLGRPHSSAFTNPPPFRSVHPVLALLRTTPPRTPSRSSSPTTPRSAQTDTRTRCTITVQSPSTISWVIYKRYNNFDKLHKQLSKNICRLPPKRVSSSAIEFIKNRMSQLQGTFVSCQAAQPRQEPRFDRVSQGSRQCQADALERQFWSGGQGPQVDGQIGVAAAEYPDKSEEERKVYELVDALKSNPNCVAGIAVFENYFFSCPRLSRMPFGTFSSGIPPTRAATAGGSSKRAATTSTARPQPRGVDLICRLSTLSATRTHERTSTYLLASTRACDRSTSRPHPRGARVQTGRVSPP